MKCTNCLLDKSVDSYYKCNKNSSGLQQPCKDCSRVARTEKRRKRRERCIKQLGGKCIDCGSTENLEFDHNDPSTKEGWIHILLQCKEEILQKELAKCVLRCKDHHVQKTARESHARQVLAEHGTASRYRQGCKCPLCLAAERNRTRERSREYWRRNNGYYERNADS